MIESGLCGVLRKMGLITDEQLEAAKIRRKQLSEDQQLGDFLVAAGAITTGQLRAAQAIQKKMKRGKQVDAMMDILEARTTVWEKTILQVS